MVKGLQKFIENFDIKTRTIGGHKYLVLYKGVRSDFGSWWVDSGQGWPRHKKMGQDKGAYAPGNLVRCREWSTNRRNDCGKGLHVGCFDFARGFVYDRLWLVMVEVLVKPSNIVCVPINCEGKIRCKSLRVVKVVER